MESHTAHDDGDGTLLDVPNLEAIDLNLYRANFVFTDPYPLYGGQVAAQALLAAGLSVEHGRQPHSMHGYFLRPGDASRPTVFQVFCDRDGRSFSARRVVAVQGGNVIFNMSASFHVDEEGRDQQEPHLPEVPAPQAATPFQLPRLFSFEGREVPQPYADGDMPTRFWARCTVALGDQPILNACALTYLSDMFTGLAKLNDGEFASSSSLDHVVWFHRSIDMQDWLLTDLVPHSVSGGRGWYTGSVFDAAGILVASIAQECLFRRQR